MKKGLVFSLEALLAVTFIFMFSIVILVFSSSSYMSEVNTERLHYMSEDAMAVLTKTTVAEAMDIPKIKEYVETGVINSTNLNRTLMDIIGSFWTTRDFDIARNITNSVLENIIPSSIGYDVSMLDIYGELTSVGSRDKPVISTMTVSKNILSGYQMDMPVQGYMALAEMVKKFTKTYSSYFYFGGFVGQGDLTFFISDLPLDAAATEIYVEGSFGSAFHLYLNNYDCGLVEKIAGGNFPVDAKSFTDPTCLSYVVKGAGTSNIFTINFTDPDITKQYIGGGFVKIAYNTSTLAPPIADVYRQYLEGISNITNLYDSFYVPGTLTGMNINLEFTANKQLHMKIGNVSVFLDDSSQFIDNNTLFSELNYNSLSKKTIPFRLGHYELAESQEYGYVNTVILTTSLTRNMGNLDLPLAGAQITCMEPDSLTETHVTRICAARNLDEIFVNIVLNYTGNKVGLVTFHSTVPSGEQYIEAPTSDNVTLITNEISDSSSNYEKIQKSGQATRCLCCAIYEATKYLTDPTRNNSIILMSDGDATDCKGPQCPNVPADICKNNPGQAAIIEACVAGSQNKTVHTIGFGGEANNVLLQDIAACGKGLWRAADNYTGLLDIYEFFASYVAQQSLKYDYQPAVPVGVSSVLSPNSYIEYNYIPEIPTYGFGEISMNFETPKITTGQGCNASFLIPGIFTVDEIRRTSYSSQYWTKQLIINNSKGTQTVYNLTEYGTNFTTLGDPYIVRFPPTYASSGELNDLWLVIGENSTRSSGECSNDDKVIYTARFIPSTTFTHVYPYMISRHVRIYYDADHDGTQDGSYTIDVGPGPFDDPTVYDVGPQIDPAITQNAVDAALIELLEILNVEIPPFSGLPGSPTNPIDVVLNENVIIIEKTISSVPSLWGPAIVQVKVWV